MYGVIIFTVFATSSAWSQIISYQTDCSGEEWKCRDGSCVSVDDTCDGLRNCPDGSDETHALCRKVQCQSNWFRCAYGACVDGPAPCDGVRDCADNSDELLRRCRGEVQEVSGFFKCDSGQQIPASSHCNGAKDCDDGSDERLKECAGKRCPANMVQCAYGACVKAGSECDDKQDCADGSDESDEVCNRQQPAVNILKLPSDSGSPPECGRLPVINSSTINPDVPMNIIPWNVLIYSRTTRPFKHICCGTLISERTVIGAAYCFWDQAKNSPADATDYIVSVGTQTRRWSKSLRDPHIQVSEIEKIKIHSHFFGVTTNFQSDLAVLILKPAVKLNPYVSPACVDFDRDFEKYQLKAGNKGKVIGFGQMKKGEKFEYPLTVLDIPVLDIGQCFREAPPAFRQLITNDKICLGDKNGTGLGKGFGGSGVTFESTERGITRHYLRGIISTAPVVEESDNITTPTIATVTLLSKYEDFVKENVA